MSARDGVDVLRVLDAEIAELRAVGGAGVAVHALTKARAAIAGLVAAAESVLAISENASFESGYCCCGDEMRSHASASSSGHTPMDSGAYYGGSAISELRTALANVGASA